MRVIVFDRELHEPLTVVEIPQWLADQAKAGRPIRLAPRQEVRVDWSASPSAVEDFTIQTVTLTFERVQRGGGYRDGDYTKLETLFWYAYADDPETALLLRAAFLPGQVGEMQRREKKAYVMGLFGLARP